MNRFPMQSLGPLDSPEPWKVVRALDAPRDAVKTAVVFRFSREVREGLVLMARASDRALSDVVTRLVARAPESLSMPLFFEKRGRPNADPLFEGFNQVAKLESPLGGVSTVAVGAWVDQALMLKAETIELLEQVAKASKLSADEALDALVLDALARVV